MTSGQTPENMIPKCALSLSLSISHFFSSLGVNKIKVDKKVPIVPMTTDIRRLFADDSLKNIINRLYGNHQSIETK